MKRATYAIISADMDGDGEFTPILMLDHVSITFNGEKVYLLEEEVDCDDIRTVFIKGTGTFRPLVDEFIRDAFFRGRCPTLDINIQGIFSVFGPFQITEIGYHKGPIWDICETISMASAGRVEVKANSQSWGEKNGV